MAPYLGPAEKAIAANKALAQAKEKHSFSIIFAFLQLSQMYLDVYILDDLRGIVDLAFCLTLSGSSQLAL
jgi:hypothetical protein